MLCAGLIMIRTCIGPQKRNSGSLLPGFQSLPGHPHSSSFLIVSCVSKSSLLTTSHSSTPHLVVGSSFPYANLIIILCRICLQLLITLRTSSQIYQLRVPLCLIFQVIFPSALGQKNSVITPLPTGDIFQDTQWMSETVPSTEPYMYYIFFSYTYLYISMRKFNL